MDTGYLDSQRDLGINQPVSNRVSFRRVTTCSPLKSQGFSDNTFDELVDGFRDNEVNVSIYAYGHNAYQPMELWSRQDLPLNDTTFVYSMDEFLTPQSAYYMM